MEGLASGPFQVGDFRLAISLRTDISWALHPGASEQISLWHMRRAGSAARADQRLRGSREVARVCAMGRSARRTLRQSPP